MRSTPLLLDRVRHIKYDLQAIWDLDHLMPGGFNHFLGSEVTPALVHNLLLFGLKSEDPGLTMSDLKRIMVSCDIAGEDKQVEIFATCAAELIAAGWICRSENPGDVKGDPQKDPEILSTKTLILNLATIACGVCGVSPADAWLMTPSEIIALYDHHTDREKIEGLYNDYKFGMTCSVILGAAGVKKQGGMPFEWKDFVRVDQQAKEISAQDATNMINLMKATFGGK